MSYLIDLSGQRFGRLTVIKKGVPDGKSTNARWLCKCDCGKEVVVRSTTLRNGESKSCGCIRSEYARSRMTTHGLSRSRLYHIWSSMIERCCTPTNPAFNEYGRRGIRVCDSWKNNFEAFNAWAKDNGYSDELSIDRIDNDKGYEPNNCRWATAKEQASNRRPRRWHKKPNEEV